jgi:hypothetical protein
MSDEAPKLSDYEISMLIIERDTSQCRKERIDELLNKIGAAKGYEEADKQSKTDRSKLPAVKEETFLILKFEPQEGSRLGSYEVAYKNNNLEDKWQQAFNVLRNANSIINDRYRGEGYQFSYWLYEGKIYRQKLKR